MANAPGEYCLETDLRAVTSVSDVILPSNPFFGSAWNSLTRGRRAENDYKVIPLTIGVPAVPSLRMT